MTGTYVIEKSSTLNQINIFDTSREDVDGLALQIALLDINNNDGFVAINDEESENTIDVTEFVNYLECYEIEVPETLQGQFAAVLKNEWNIELEQEVKINMTCNVTFDEEGNKNYIFTGKVNNKEFTFIQIKINGNIRNFGFENTVELTDAEYNKVIDSVNQW